MNDPRSSSPEQPFLVVQIIAGAMMSGVLMFGLVAIVLTLESEPGNPLVAYIAVAATVGALGLVNVLPPLIVNSQRGQLKQAVSGDSANGPENADSPSAQSFQGLFQTKKILEFAMLEGAAFLCLIAYIVTVQWWLWIFVAALLAVMGAMFPTLSKYESWKQAQQQLLDLESST